MCGSTASRRGRYATDASHYQIMPLGVVAAAHDRRSRTGDRDCRARRRAACCRAAAARRRPARPSTNRWSSTARSISTASSISTSPARALRGRARHRARRSQPRSSSRTACGFRSISRPPRAPPSAAWPATIPAAARSLRYGNTRDNVLSIDALLADGTLAHFGPVGGRSLRRAGIAAAAAGARPARASARARPTRSRRAFRKCSAGSAATISTRWCRARTTSISRTSWSARKARSPSRPRSS